MEDPVFFEQAIAHLKELGFKVELVIDGGIQWADVGDAGESFNAAHILTMIISAKNRKQAIHALQHVDYPYPEEHCDDCGEVKSECTCES